MLEARAFEPDFLRRLDRLVLGIRRARTIRAGERALGRAQGVGMELESFREYAEGDDLRFLDWSALARLDDLFMRTYRPEREVEVTVLIDTSASMGLPRRDDKLGFALTLAAALAYVAIVNNDAARLVAFGKPRRTTALRTTPFHRRRESYLSFKPFVAALEPGGETRLAAASGELLLERRPRGVVIVVSDFLVGPLEYEKALASLTSAGHEVKVVHTMGETESTGAYPPGLYRVRDCETGELREIALGRHAAEACRRRVEQIASRVRDFCLAREIAYVRAFGASHLDRIIESEFPRLGLVR